VQDDFTKLESSDHWLGWLPDTPDRSPSLYWLTKKALTSRLLVRALFVAVSTSALGGTRTPNLLIRSQMLYPLSYERMRFA
jgi:hypothetical protein